MENKSNLYSMCQGLDFVTRKLRLRWLAHVHGTNKGHRMEGNLGGCRRKSIPNKKWQDGVQGAMMKFVVKTSGTDAMDRVEWREMY